MSPPLPFLSAPRAVSPLIPIQVTLKLPILPLPTPPVGQGASPHTPKALSTKREMEAPYRGESRLRPRGVGPRRLLVLLSGQRRIAERLRKFALSLGFPRLRLSSQKPCRRLRFGTCSGRSLHYHYSTLFQKMSILLRVFLKNPCGKPSLPEFSTQFSTRLATLRRP